MKRKMWLLTAALAVGCFLPQAAMAESTDVTLNVNHEQVAVDETTGAPYINDSGRTMVPLRVVNNYLDYTTDWTSDGKIHITGRDGAVDVTIQAGSTAYTANGEAGSFETAPLVREDGRTYLPVRDFSELYGKVYWDSATRTVWVYDGEGPMYVFSGTDVIRYNGAGDADMVAMPEGYEIDMTDVPEYICKQKVFDGKTYLSIVYNRDSLLNAELFCDDGEQMTSLGGINVTADFTVDGNTLYSTAGTHAGHAGTGVLNPYRLYAQSLGDGGKSGRYTLDFAVNECTLAIEDGNLIATAPDGTRHVVDLATLVPDEK